MKGKRGIGERGEEQAEQFLRQRDLQILVRNFCTQFGEVDLICRDGDELVFVEVKLRNSDSFGTALESVTPRKLSRIQTAAEKWLQKNNLEAEPWRIDLVAIQNGEIDWLKSIS